MCSFLIYLIAMTREVTTNDENIYEQVCNFLKAFSSRQSAVGGQRSVISVNEELKASSQQQITLSNLIRYILI